MDNVTDGTVDTSSVVSGKDKVSDNIDVGETIGNWVVDRVTGRTAAGSDTDVGKDTGSADVVVLVVDVVAAG